MCGIAGLQICGDENIRPDALACLQASLFHRGPDAQNHLVVEATGLVVTRLAIVDPLNGNQPLFSKAGSVLVANGEIYNAPELRATLSGYPFVTGSDCEVILPLYESHGLDFADHLRGMFAIAILDTTANRLVLARDPFGIKPLYYIEGEDCFAFASELSSLLDAGFAKRETDDMACAEFFQARYVCGTRTIIPHIRRLEPGETILVEGGRIRRSRHGKTWPPYADHDAPKPTRAFGWRPDTALLDTFERVIFDSVAVHLRSDVPWRLLYSGGIDSTILMLAAREVGCAAPHAITVGYEGKSDTDESWRALELARGASVNCNRIAMTSKDFWTLAPRIVAAADDPIADPALLPLYMLGRETQRQGAKVAVCGEGADEIFAGYGRYRRATLPAFLRRRHGRRGVFSKSDVPSDRFAGWNDALDRLEQVQEKAWSSRLQVLQAIDMLEWLPNCLLIKLDRALMANGVEGRTPFLDREVVAFARDLPDRFKANPWVGKRLLRDWLARTYPQSQPYARKRGFGVPVAQWMEERREELGTLVSAQPGIARQFDSVAVKHIFDRCSENAQPAWTLLFYALWHSHHILGLSSEDDVAAVLSAASNAGS